ncbi:hypothetical protein NC652_022333 [Populus alba x Populus x berolinensis]|nr:hypothetical protein NC652_022333 [Populus alba x Populus x berolinensis]
MEPKQLANLHHSSHSLGSMNMQFNAHAGQSGSLLMRMSQQQSRGQMLNETTNSHVPRLSSSIGQPIASNALAGGVSARNGLAENGRGIGFNPGTFQEEISSEIKGPGGFMPSYNVFSDLRQHRSHDWELQNVGMTFKGSQQSNSASQCFQQEMQRSNVNAQSLEHPINTFFAENSMRVKTERVPDANPQTALFNEQLDQEDLMSALLKQQQQGGIGLAENEFDFDGYSLDNIPV